MNNDQINHHNKHLKVADLLDDHSADTATVAPIAVCEADLNDLITKIIQADGQAIEDTSGTAEEKDQARQVMTALTLKCCNAARAHATFIGDQGLLRKIDFTPSELAKQRDGELHTTCRRAYTNVQPLAASLVAYLVSAIDLTDWDASISLFLDLITEPGDRIDDRKVAGLKVDAYQADVTTLLNTRLDVYMNLFLPTAPFLVEEYRLARAIDDLGGSPSTWVHVNTVEAGSGVTTPTFTAGAAKALKLENAGTTDLSFQMLHSNAPVGTPKLLTSGTTFIGLIGDLAPAGNAFKVTNLDGATEGSFRITIG